MRGLRLAKERVTVCLPAAATVDLLTALEAALAPYDKNKIVEDQSDWHGEWDSWRIQGGEGESALPVRAGCEEDPRLVRMAMHPDGTPRLQSPSRCDGGPREALDFARDRDASARSAREQWTYWHELSACYPGARPLRHFLAIYRGNPSRYSVRDARRDHANQQALQAFTRERLGETSQPVWHEFNDPVDIFAPPMDSYVRRVTAAVIPTAALLTLDRRWVDETSFNGPVIGRERSDQYFEFADRYLDELASDSMVVRVLFHS
jgi:hypothetical protein